MKQFLLCLLLCVLLAGCGPAPVDPTVPDISPIETQNTTGPISPATETQPTETAPAARLTYTLYLPDDQAEHFLQQVVETDRIDADGVLLELQEKGVLPYGVIMNAFGSEGSQLMIDFNRDFEDLICSMGTSGERMIVGSVVNTFLNAFQAESVVFTIDGEILESGHVIYDFPITFME